MPTPLKLTRGGALLLANILNLPGALKKPGEQIVASLFAEKLESRYVRGEDLPMPKRERGEDAFSDAKLADAHDAAMRAWNALEITDLIATDRQFQVAVQAAKFAQQHNGERFTFQPSIHAARLFQALKLAEDKTDEEPAVEA